MTKWGAGKEGEVERSAGEGKWIINWDDGNEERNAKIFIPNELKHLRPPEPAVEEQTPSDDNEEESIEHESEEKESDEDESEDEFDSSATNGDDKSSDDDESGAASQCVDDGSDDDEDKYEVYEQEKEELIGDIIYKKVGSTTYEWEIVDDIVPPKPFEDHDFVGLRDLDLSSETVLSDALFRLWPIPIDVQLENMNKWIDRDNKKQVKDGKKKVRPVTERELAMWIGILLSAPGFAENGEALFNNPSKQPYNMFPPAPNLKKVTGMSLTCFNDMKRYWVYSFSHPDEFDEKYKNDPWGQARHIVNKFNENRRTFVAASKRVCVDESISELKPCASKCANLVSLHRNPNKPKDMGIENNTSCCGVTGACIYVNLNEGAEMNANKEFNSELGKAAGLTAHLIDGAAGCGRDDTENHKIWICADAKFALMNALKWMSHNGHEGVLVSIYSFIHSVFICVLSHTFHVTTQNVKQYHYGFPKAEFAAYISDWPRGAYIVGKCNISDSETVCFAAYKWNYKKTFYFAFTKNAGETKPSPRFSYIAQFNDDDGNLKSIHINRPQVVGLYYHYANKVNVNNQYRQGYLHLEGCWGTQDGFFREATTLSGILVTDSFLLLKHHLASSHPIHKMTIGEYLRSVVHEIFFTRIWSDKTRLERSTAPLVGAQIAVQGCNSDVSSLSSDQTHSGVVVGIVADMPMTPERFCMRHCMCKTMEMESAADGERLKRSRCDLCSKGKTAYYCSSCGNSYCKDGQGRKQNKRYCFYLHVCDAFKNSGEAPDEWKEEYDEFLMEAHDMHA